jgi:Protein of unknown function (DUF1279)
MLLVEKKRLLVRFTIFWNDIVLIDSQGLLTQLALAYAVHKSLLVFRIPLAAAILPSVVKTLRRWGWNVGKAAKTTRK